MLLMALESHPFYKIIIAANRDEYFDRPTRTAGFWPEKPDVLGGKDLLAGGTWLGVTRMGKISAITNYRDPASLKKGAPSRGNLVSTYLKGNDGPEEYLSTLIENAKSYNGFNLVVGDMEGLYWYSNRGNGPKKIGKGIFGLSNHLLDTPWPKVVRGKEILQESMAKKKGLEPEALLELLKDDLRPDDKDLPNTGVELEWERILSPIFISSPSYGTRSSTVILFDTKGKVTFIERTYESSTRNENTVEYTFKIGASF